MTLSHTAWTLPALLCALSMPVAAVAESMSLPLTDDSYINGAAPTKNYGASSTIAVNKWGPNDGLLKFDAAVLAGADVGSATLQFNLREIAVCGNVAVYRVTSNWIETSVTWDARPSIAASPSVNLTLCPTDVGEVQVDVTSLAQKWADGSATDYGLLLRAEAYLKARIDSKEATGGIPARLVAETGSPSSAIVLDLSDPENCTIDSPGYYVLDRNWWLSPDDGAEPNAQCAGAVRIASKGVTLDLQGLAIRSGDQWGSYEPVLWIDTASSVTLRNGEVVGIFVAIGSSISGSTITLENVRAGGGALLANRAVTVRGGRYSGTYEAPLQVGPFSRVLGAEFDCTDANCLSVRGSSQVRSCTFAVNTSGAPAISLVGDDSILEGNVFNGWLSIAGNRNVVARNFSSTGYIVVNGAGNVIDGNIGPDVSFETGGNFYGGNRAALPGGFSGTAGNVDWGGNVTY